MAFRSSGRACAEALRAATTFSAASVRVSAVTSSSPLSFRILRPSSTLVPASRTTSGTVGLSSLHGLHHALRHPVAAVDAGEDVDQHRLAPSDRRAPGGTRCRHPLGRGAAAHVEEVGRRAAGVLDHVHRGHGQAGAVHDAADLAVERHVVDPVLRRLRLARILLGVVAQLAHVGPAEQRVVVERHLAVERQQLAVGA